MKKNKKKVYKQTKKRYLKRGIRAKNNSRLFLFRSNKQIYAQIIDYSSGHTLISFSTLEILKDIKILYNVLRKSESYFVGIILAKLLIKLDIKKIIFDRGNKSYKGVIKLLAEGLRNYNLEL